MLGQSLLLFCPNSHVLASEERGSGSRSQYPGAFSLVHLLSGLPLMSLDALKRG